MKVVSYIASLCFSALILIYPFNQSYSQEASLNGTLLSIPVVKVGADYYSIVLAIIAGTDPVELSLSEAEQLTDANSVGASSFANNTLSIPSLPYEGSSYNLQLNLISEDPVVFRLAAADVNEPTPEPDAGADTNNGVVVGGGDAWLYEQAECTDWFFSGGPTGTDFSNDNHGNSGVKAGSVVFPQGSCEQAHTYSYGQSLIDGERKLKSENPPIAESVQGTAPLRETDTFSYTSRNALGRLVELLYRVDTTNNDSSIPAADGGGETGFASSLVWDYEVGTSTSLPRPIRYEEHERIVNANDYNELIIAYSVSWDYEADGSVTSASFQQYDEDLEDYINGRYRFVIENGDLVMHIEADVSGEIVPLQKTVMPGKTLFDLDQLPLPYPTGQVSTENSWILPQAYTRYLWDGDSNEWIIYEKQEIPSVTDEGYPIKVLHSAQDDVTGELQLESTYYYGYKTDWAGTIYRWIEVANELGGDSAWIYNFRSDIIEIQL